MMTTTLEGTERFEMSEIALLDAWIEVLEYPNRPTFILDLASNSAAPIHYNKILHRRTDLRLSIDTELSKDVSEFCQWALAGGNEFQGYRFLGYDWISTTVGMRFKVIGGIVHEEHNTYEHRLAVRYNSKPRNSEEELSLSMKNASLKGTIGGESLDEIGAPFPMPAWNKDVDRFDWTNPNPVIDLPKYAKFLRHFPWETTLLALTSFGCIQGPMKNWSDDLRRKCVILVSDSRPAALYYGERKVLIYNEGYLSIIGSKHPAVLGVPYDVAWGPVADRFALKFDQAARTGKASSVTNANINIERAGQVAEAYFSWEIIPTIGPDGTISFYNPVYETTREVIIERRMKSLLSFGQSISTKTSLSHFWDSILDGLRPDIYDVPFCLLYSTSPDDFQETGYVWNLEGTIGIIQEKEDADSSDLFSTPYSYAKLQEAFKSGRPTFLHTEDGTLSAKCVENVTPRGFDDKCKSAVILAIIVSSRILGFLILGINPRRPYDSDYEDFLHVLGGMLGTAGASAVLFEEEIRRGQLVSEQFRKMSEEAKDNETKFRKMFDAAPVGMFAIDANRKLQYTNNRWHTITGRSKDATPILSWPELFFDEDIPLVNEEMAKLVVDLLPVNVEIRMKKPWIMNEMADATPVEGTTWTIVAAYPDLYPDGTLRGIVGCITDISKQKWAEDYEKQRTKQAVEMKRRQENFIDFTSHELRNPMSAILHCADEIYSSLSHFKNMAVVDTKFKNWVEEITDLAMTIVHCSEHQKRIIDDILTLSKLESDLLIILPMDVEPLSVIHTALKMFEGELHKGDVGMDLVVEKSFHEMKISWARLDSSRLLQIIINLVGNAIKFTRTEKKRHIEIIVNASVDRPSNGAYGVTYLPTRTQEADNAEGKEWGDGQAFYLHIAVKDTDGGSGLGLFISKELTERQGGAIGVESEAGVGSTFAFYIKARCCASPEKLLDLDILHPINAHDIAAVASDSRVELKPAPPLSTPPIIDSIPSTPTPHSNISLRPSEASRYVLIVEDNLVNQKVLSRQLKNIGCHVHVANHGQEALDFVEKSCFWKSKASGKGVPLSVILMDLEMPVMTGLDCVKKIRSLQDEGTILGHIPVIAVTANARNEQLLRAKSCGMDAVVTKPFRIPELVPNMERLVAEYMERNTGSGSWHW